MRVRDILDLFPDLRLRAGAQGLERSVRWVHVVDQPDMASWMRDGTFVLTTGIGWGRDPGVHGAEVSQIAEAGAAGLLIAVGRFLARVSQEAIGEAERLGLPLVEAPFSLPFIDITVEVQSRLIGEQYQLLTQADRIHRALTAAALEAGDLQRIAERLSELLLCDVAVYSARETTGESAVLACVGPLPTGTRHQRALRRAREMREPLSQDSKGRAALYVPIGAGEAPHAVLALFSRSGDFDQVVPAAAEHAAAVIALHLAHQRELTEMERRVNASYVDALLTGALGPGDLAAAERARLRGLDPKGTFRVVIARQSHSGALTSREEFSRRQDLLYAVETGLAALSKPAATTYSLNRVLILWPSGPGDRDHLVRLHRGAEARLGSGLVLSASAPVKGLAGVQRASWEAERLLGVARGGQEVLLYEDHVLLRLLGRNDPVMRRELEVSVVGRLRAERQGDALVETLGALVECGYRHLDAARRLGVHRNTMQKRVARIESALGRSLQDPEMQTLIYLSLSVSRMEG